MKKFFALIIIMMITLVANAQWKTENVDNGFDEPYKIAYCRAGSGTGFLKLEEYNGAISFYFSDTKTYICGDQAVIDVSFKVDGQYIKYNTVATVFTNDMIIFYDDLATWEYFLAFQKATEFKLRITDVDCNTQTVYSFNMTGSTAAFNKMNE